LLGLSASAGFGGNLQIIWLVVIAKISSLSKKQTTTI